jgi:hypothetical protein
VTKEERLLDLKAVLAFGNHKGAKEKPDLLRKLCTADVNHGFALALPLNKIHLPPGVHMAPMNIAHQNTIDELGRIVGKIASPMTNPSSTGRLGQVSKQQSPEGRAHPLHVWLSTAEAVQLDCNSKDLVPEL